MQHDFYSFETWFCFRPAMRRPSSSQKEPNSLSSHVFGAGGALLAWFHIWSIKTHKDCWIPAIFHQISSTRLHASPVIKGPSPKRPTVVDVELDVFVVLEVEEAVVLVLVTLVLLLVWLVLVVDVLVIVLELDIVPHPTEWKSKKSNGSPIIGEM